MRTAFILLFAGIAAELGLAPAAAQTAPEGTLPPNVAPVTPMAPVTPATPQGGR